MIGEYSGAVPLAAVVLTDNEPVKRRGGHNIAYNDTNPALEFSALEQCTQWFDYVAIGHPNAVLQMDESALFEKLAEYVAHGAFFFRNVKKKKTASTFASRFGGFDFIPKRRGPSLVRETHVQAFSNLCYLDEFPPL